MPFGPVNAPPVYTAMIRQFQVEWMNLFQLYCSNEPTKVNSNQTNVKMITPNLPKSNKPDDFRKGAHLPQLAINDAFVLQDKDTISTPPPSGSYTACTMVR